MQTQAISLDRFEMPWHMYNMFNNVMDGKPDTELIETPTRIAA